MQNFSEYIVYVDESGDHGMHNINPNYPIFVLAFCIFRKGDYIQKVVPDLQKFKFKYWGHDSIILHEHDIRKSMSNGYELLSNPQVRNAFFEDLNQIITNSPFNVIASVIRKDKLTGYTYPSNPYELSMLFCMERLINWLCECDEEGKLLHVIFESRGKVEDNELELEFRRICDNASSSSVTTKTDFSRMQFALHFVNKQANSSGLQLADLVARPIGLHILKPYQGNQAFDIIREKLVSHSNGVFKGKGLKVFPK